MANGETYKVGLEFADGSLEVKHTAFYLKQINVVGFSVSDVGPKVINWWNTELATSGLTAGVKGLYFTNIALSAVTLRKVDPLEQTVASYVTGLPIAGNQSSSQALPQENAILLSLRTGSIGRSYRGRMYLPAPAESALNFNFTLAAAEDIAQQTAALFSSLKSLGIGTDNARAVVFSRFSKDENPTPPHERATPVTTDILQVKCDTWMRAQRRRNVRAPLYSQATV